MGEIRCHEICFSGVPNDWNSALPLGNGRMGAMVFVQEHVLHVALNHYDCYYQSGGGQTFQDPARFAETYQELCRRAEQVRGREAAERSHYARTLHPSTGGRPSYQGASYPMGGELLLTLDDSVDMQHIELKLHIERAEVTLTAGTGDRCVGAKLLAAGTGRNLDFFIPDSRRIMEKGSL